MKKCYLIIAEPPGMTCGSMEFFEVPLPTYLPEGAVLRFKPWENRDTIFYARVRRIEFTVVGEVNYSKDIQMHVFAEADLHKTNATSEEWQEFSETAAA